MRGGLVRVEGENQYRGQSVVLRQFEPHRKQTTKNGVSLAAICHPTTQNGTLALAVNDAHGIYLRRIAASHRTLPTVSVFTYVGSLPATAENLEAVCTLRTSQSSELVVVKNWWEVVKEYAKWMMGVTSKVMVESGSGIVVCSALVVKKTILLPVICSTVIGWLFWNTSFDDSPIQTMKEALHDVGETTKAAAQTEKYAVQCIGGVLVSMTTCALIWLCWKVMRRISQWAKLLEGTGEKGGKPAPVTTDLTPIMPVVQPTVEAVGVPKCNTADGAETSGVPSEVDFTLEEAKEIDPICMAHALLLADKDHSPLCMDPCASVLAIATRKMSCDFSTQSSTCPSVRGKTDYVPLCMDHADEYQTWITSIKCRHGECWEKALYGTPMAVKYVNVRRMRVIGFCNQHV